MKMFSIAKFLFFNFSFAKSQEASATSGTQCYDNTHNCGDGAFCDQLSVADDLKDNDIDYSETEDGLSPEGTFQCICPDGFELGEDNNCTMIDGFQPPTQRRRLPDQPYMCIPHLISSRGFRCRSEMLDEFVKERASGLTVTEEITEKNKFKEICEEKCLENDVCFAYSFESIGIWPYKDICRLYAECDHTLVGNQPAQVYGEIFSLNCTEVTVTQTNQHEGMCTEQKMSANWGPKDAWGLRCTLTPFELVQPIAEFILSTDSVQDQLHLGDRDDIASCKDKCIANHACTLFGLESRPVEGDSTFHEVCQLFDQCHTLKEPHKVAQSNHQPGTIYRELFNLVCNSWSAWSNWSDCSTANQMQRTGQCGKKTRWRSCSTGDSRDCRGEAVEEEFCEGECQYIRPHQKELCRVTQLSEGGYQCSGERLQTLVWNSDSDAVEQRAVDQTQMEICRKQCWDDVYCNAFSMNRHLSDNRQNRCIFYNYCDDTQLVGADRDAMGEGEDGTPPEFGVYLLYCKWATWTTWNEWGYCTQVSDAPPTFKKQRYLGCEINGISVPPLGYCHLEGNETGVEQVGEQSCLPCPDTSMHCAQCYDNAHNCGVGAFCDQLTVAGPLQEGHPDYDANKVMSSLAGTFQCICPDGFELDDQNNCQMINGFQPPPQPEKIPKLPNTCTARLISSRGDRCRSEILDTFAQESELLSDDGFKALCKERCMENADCYAYSIGHRVGLDFDICQLYKECEHTLIGNRPGYSYKEIFKLECVECVQGQTCHPCADGRHNCQGLAVCHELSVASGTWQCKCPDGYDVTGDEENQCQDINECTSRTYSCATNEDCINTTGSYYCQCKQGFELADGTCKNVNECTLETHDCDQQAQCVDTEGFYNCLCPQGLRGDGWQCSDTCQLFSIQCNITSGFSLKIDEPCRSSQYSHIPSDYTGLYAYSKYVSDTTQISSNCHISHDGQLNFQFEECGTVQGQGSSGDENLVFQTYVRHFVVIKGISTSGMKPIPVQCAIGTIALSSDSGEQTVKIGKSDEPAANSQISSDHLVETFELGLEVGLLRKDRFLPLTSGDELQVGERIRVQLTSKLTPYSFVLHDCAVSSGGVSIALYTGFCPSVDSQFANLQFRDMTSFDLSIFQLSAENTLKFTCDVKMFSDGEQLPDCANTNNVHERKKRGDDYEEYESVSVTVTIATTNLTETDQVQLKFAESESDSSAFSVTISSLWIVAIILLN